MVIMEWVCGDNSGCGDNGVGVVIMEGVIMEWLYAWGGGRTYVVILLLACLLHFSICV